MPPTAKPSPYEEVPDIQAQVETVVAKHVFRVIFAIVSAAFLLGCWMTKLQLDVSRALSINDPMVAKLVAQHEWMINQHEARLVRIEHKP